MNGSSWMEITQTSMEMRKRMITFIFEQIMTSWYAVMSVIFLMIRVWCFDKGWRNWEIMSWKTISVIVWRRNEYRMIRVIYSCTYTFLYIW